MKMKKIISIMVGSANFFFNGLAHADPELVYNENNELIGIRLNLPTEAKEMLKEHLSPKEQICQTTLSQFKQIVKKINEWGWCELNKDEKQLIVNYLLQTNYYKARQEDLLQVIESISLINDGEYIKCFASERDMIINEYLDKTYLLIKNNY